ncbi:MAG: chaperone modulator CbpM, partial [Chitinophagales bacterium]
MEKNKLIPIEKICTHFEIEFSFFDQLNRMNLIEIRTIEQRHFIHQDYINDLEKMIRLHHELDINLEGIDVVFNLLQKIDALQ